MKIVIGDLLYDVSPDGNIICGTGKYAREIHLTQNGNIITCQHKDWQGNELDFVDTIVTVTGIDRATQQEIVEVTETLTPADMEIDLTDYVGCDLKIVATCLNAEGASMEVEL